MADEVFLKPALTIGQQIDLLKSKGLKVTDDVEASQFLTKNNYYRLNIYFHKLMDSKDHFIIGTRFSDITEIYRNDCFLRQKIFSMLEPIEIEIKTKIAYYLGTTYGSNAFYNNEIYRSIWKYKQIINTFENEILRNENNPVILHHKSTYSGVFPIWVIVEFLSFNCISKYLTNLQIHDQKYIAKTGYGINEYYLGNWIHSLSVVRNICAHYGYLYKREYTVPISFGYDLKKFAGQENNLFGIFYCIKKLSPIDKWQEFFSEIIGRIGKKVLTEHYYFPMDFSGLQI